jgi:hypothetical protein
MKNIHTRCDYMVIHWYILDMSNYSDSVIADKLQQNIQF